jgi:hypothetical protein
MKITTVFRIVLLAMMAISLGFVTSTFADDSARNNLEQVQTLLRSAAWDNDASAPPNNEKRADLLKQAYDLLKTVPGVGYPKHLAKAKKFVQDALHGVTKGASDQQVTGYIHDAETEVRAIE